jgi:hypothetical protein
MSLQSLAKTVQDQGRGNDSVLVHMTPGEVHGLQSLALAHGGSLTTNPTTGLPEAGFLDTILSIGGGLVGGMVGGPLGAAIGSGLGTYIGGGSPQKALMSGVMGYGLGGLGEGFEAIGQNVNQTALTNEVARQAAEQGIAPNEIAAEMAAGWKPDVTKFSSSSDLVSGLKKVTESPQSAWDFAKGNLKYLGAAGLGLAGMMAPGQTAIPGAQAKTGYAPTYGYNAPKQIVDPVTGKVTMVSPSYMQGTPFPYTYYAANGGQVPYPAGGMGYPQAHMQDKTDFYAQSTATPTPTAVIGAAPQTDYDARINPQGDVMRAAGGGEIYGGEDKGPYTSKKSKQAQADLALSKYIQELAAQSNYAQGGIASLGEYAAGGKLLQGPGDGMSDSIPAVIKGAKPQRAALAQGEFVVPADVVSHLGNGSTDAGAKRLYAMMDKVRQARTGTKKQGRQINPEKFMPA